MTTKSTRQPLTKDEEIAKLRAKLAKLEEGLGEPEQSPENQPIKQDEYIPVMSLIPYNLNLSTKEAGQGNIKKFTKFGEIKRILYKDLLDIIEVHPSFMESGYFYILDPRFIRQAGLDETYSKILTKEKIEQILSTNSEECVELYNSTNPNQQEIIIELLVSKIRDNPDSVNLNIVDRISRISKKDIVKMAEDSRPVEEEEAEK